MATSPDPTQQVQNILQVIRDLGLQPYTPPKPLPEISADDVHPRLLARPRTTTRVGHRTARRAHLNGEPESPPPHGTPPFDMGYLDI